VEKYRFEKEEAKDISDFLFPIIQIAPAKRATAQESIETPWVSLVDLEKDVEMP
jgi:serine/threonine-protein kinase SRPK3